MLTMSRSCNAASEQGSSNGWKETYRSTAESVESFEDSADSDNSSSSSHASRSQSGSSLQPPIGCITTHSVSAVIRPEKKMPPIDPLQFVKIQKNELSKKAVEQIKLAEKVKITKEKIKEVEEEWQNNLMSWKSKRKLTKNNSEDELVLSRNTNRKTKTFSEILNEKARSGGRIGYNLHRYADVEDAEEEMKRNEERKEYFQQYESDQFDEENMTFDQLAAAAASASELSFDPTESNLNRLLKTNAVEQYSEEEMCRKGLGTVVVFDTTLLQEFSVKSDGCDVKQVTGRETGANEMSSEVAQQQYQQHQQQLQQLQQQQSRAFNTTAQFEGTMPEPAYPSTQIVSSQSQPQCNEFNQEAPLNNNSNSMATIPHQQQPLIQKKVHVPINDWKSSQGKSPKQSVPSSDDDAAAAAHHNSSFEVEDEEDELDEELERLRLDQERSFKAKLYAFENLAKQEEEAARKAAESSRRRQQSRQAKLAAERSKSLGNIQQSSSSSSHQKTPVSASYSISSSSIPATHQSVAGSSGNSSSSFSPETSATAAPTTKTHLESQSKSMQNLNSSSISPEYSLLSTSNSTNSTVYNFTEKAQRSHQDVEAQAQVSAKAEQPKMNSVQALQKQQQQTLVKQVDYPGAAGSHLNSQPQSVPISQQQQQAQNIYENITPLGFPIQQPPQPTPPAAAPAPIQQQHLPLDPVADSNAIRNASQKLLQQQQQIYQNQPLPYQSQPQQQLHYPLDSYSNVPPNFAYQQANLMQPQQLPVPLQHPIQPTDSILNDKVINPVPIRGYPIVDDVGLPPIQITKSIQSGTSKPYNQMQPSIPVAAAKQPEEEHLYVNQNQLMLNPSGKSLTSAGYQYDYHPSSATYENYNPALHYQTEPNYENKTLIQKRVEDASNGNAAYQHEQFPPQQMNAYPNTSNQYLYYPKPYSASSASLKPITKQQLQQQQQQMQQQQQPQMPQQMMPTVPVSQNNGARYAPNAYSGQQQQQQQQPRVAYNQNHWLLQEAELRRQLDSMESSSGGWLKNAANGMPQQQPQHPKNVTPSVSGKKKCSCCMEELGKGCAAMVVESLSLFYHINCFRCSVCNVQLGNGTVGTDVRVRNNKLHCQNCYSNDEAGLKFSRV